MTAQTLEVDALIAEHAVVAEGRLFIQGGGIFSMSVAGAWPASVALSLAGAFKVPYTATNQTHRFSVALEAEDGTTVQLPMQSPTGEPLTRIDGDFAVGRPVQMKPGDDQLVPFAFNFGGLVLPQPGRYTFVVSVAEQTLSRSSIRVEAVPAIAMR